MEKCDHVAFQVGDMDAAVRFYVEKLGFARRKIGRTVYYYSQGNPDETIGR